jgi:galactose mutarotase-like enzyme
MEIKVDSENHLTLNPKTGRILQLRLHGKTVIKQAAENTGSGNFLMFPWVNRVEDNPFTVLSEYFDGNVNPIHGLYVNDARHITVTPTEHGISVELVPHLTVEGVPKFKEHYLL